MATSLAWLQPDDGWAKFHEVGLTPPPPRSKWPTWAEPSSALDPRQREKLWEFVGGLSARGTSIVYSTHYVQEAERHADRVLVIADGELVFSGTPRSLEEEAGMTDLGFEAAFVAFLQARGH